MVKKPKRSWNINDIYDVKFYTDVGHSVKKNISDIRLNLNLGLTFWSHYYIIDLFVYVSRLIV